MYLQPDDAQCAQACFLKPFPFPGAERESLQAVDMTHTLEASPILMPVTLTCVRQEQHALVEV